MMATKIQGHIEAALDRLLDLANQDPNNVPVLLCMATGFMMLKQTPKARNQLKRVQKVRGEERGQEKGVQKVRGERGQGLEGWNIAGATVYGHGIHDAEADSQGSQPAQAHAEGERGTGERGWGRYPRQAACCPLEWGVTVHHYLS